jgi:hypothetical protein
LKLAECFWEMEDYSAAAEVLQEVDQNTSSADLAFRARLLRARVHVRMGDSEVAEVLLGDLRAEAEIYKSQGEVVLVEAENLIAQGKGDEASPLLENMPTEWETPTVKARASDMLGYLYMERGELDRAREKFQTALLKRDDLDDYDRTRRLNDSLQDYLAAETALPDAKGERVARLQLLQANALLFGFDKPQEAAPLYAAAGVDTAADSTVAARALYGAAITYDNYLAEPDSAAFYREELIARYPNSPQAYEATHGRGADLFGYLLVQRKAIQEDNLANLSDEERAALASDSDVTAGLGGPSRRDRIGVRRRMVYLSRRPNIVFPPPQEAIEAATRRQETELQTLQDELARQAAADSLAATLPFQVDESGVAVPADSLGVMDGTQESGEINPEDAAALEEARKKAEAEAAKKAEEEAARKAEEEKKKKRDENWDRLR